MAKETIATYSAETAREVLRRLGRLEQKQNALLYGGLNQSFASIPPFNVWARAAVSNDYPTYPTSGNVAPVELGVLDPSPLAVNSTATRTFTPLSPQLAVLATTTNDSLPAQGDVVLLKWANGKWWIEATPSDAPFYVYNASGADVDSGRGLELGEVYSGDVIEADTRAGGRAYCVLQDDIADATIGRAKVTGWTTARVNVVDTAHTHCFLPQGDTVFESGFGGPLELLRTPTATSEQDILVRWQPLYRRRILTNSTISANNFGNCNFYGSSTLNGSIGTDDVYFNWMKGGITEITSGVEGWATWDDGICAWILDAAECSA